jgi:hypothetical protein
VKFKLALLAFLLATPAFAGSGTIAITPGSGATIATTTDGSSNNLSHGVQCDAAAGANCETVKAASTPAALTDPAVVVAPIGSGDIVISPSSSFTRPANTTTYTANTVVSNSTTAGSFVALSWTVTRANAGNAYVRRAVMVSSGKSITPPANFVLYLFAGTAAPTTTAGDDVAFSGAVTLVNEFCAIPITLTEKGSDDSIGRGAPDVGSECNFVAGAGVSTIWGMLTTTGAYIPTSAEVEKFILEVHQN